MPDKEPVYIPTALQYDILYWFETVILPKSSADGTFWKLMEEMDELKEVYALNGLEDMQARVSEEAADVLICFLAWCHSSGIPLRQAVRDKHRINEGRTWGPPDERGVRRHVG